MIYLSKSVFFCFTFFVFTFLSVNSASAHPHYPGDPEYVLKRHFKSPHFNTPFKTETEFLIYQMANEFSRLAVFIRSGTVPSPEDFSCFVEEWAEKSDMYNHETLVYVISVSVQKQEIIRFGEYRLPNHSIWDPETLIQLLDTSKFLPPPDELAELMHEESLKHPQLTELEPLPIFLNRHSTLNPVQMIEDSKELSNRLTILRANPMYHCRAAILLGLSYFREDAGAFHNPSEYLSRMTCHLAVADYLGEYKFGTSLDRRFAEILLDCISNRQVEVLNALTDLQSNLPPDDLQKMLPWIKVMRLRASGQDFRTIQKEHLNTVLEKIEYLRAISSTMSDNMLMKELSKEPLVSIFDQDGPSLMAYRALASRDVSFMLGKFMYPRYYMLEAAELNLMARLDVGEHVVYNQERLRGFLRRGPYPIVMSNDGSETEIDILNPGLISDHYGRHTAQAGMKYFDYLYNKWGMKEDAREMRANFEELFDGQYWSPFALSTMAKSKEKYQQHQRYMMLVSRFEPERVTAGMWNILSETKGHSWSNLHDDFYKNKTSWQLQSPPPGTAIDLKEREFNLSLYTDNAAKQNKLREFIFKQAPNSPRVPFIKLYGNRYTKEFAETNEQKFKWFEPVSDWNYIMMDTLRSRWKKSPVFQRAVIDKMITFDESAIVHLLNDYSSNMGLEEYCDLSEKYFTIMDDWVQASFALPDFVYACYALGTPERVTPWLEQYDVTGSTTSIHSKALLYEFDGEFQKAAGEYKSLHDNFETGRYLYQEMIIRMGRENAIENGMLKDYEKVVEIIFPDGIETFDSSNTKPNPTHHYLYINEKPPRRFLESSFKSGDIILAANKIRVTNFYQFRVAFKSSLPKNPIVEVLRDGEVISLKLSPIFNIYGDDWYSIQEPAEIVETEERSAEEV